MSSAATVGVQRHLSHRCKPMLNRAGRSPSPSDVPLRCSARHIVPRRATHPVAQGMSLRFPSTRAGMLPLGSGSSLPGLTVSPAPLGACSYQINRSPDRPCFKPRRTSPACRGRSCWQRAAALQRAGRRWAKPAGAAKAGPHISDHIYSTPEQWLSCCECNTESIFQQIARDSWRQEVAYLRGTKREDLVAPIPAVPCFTGL